VLTPNGPEPREIEKGMSDNIYVEIKSGLNEGDEVVLEPGKLLGDKEKKSSKQQDDKIVPTGGRPGGGREGGVGGREGGPSGRDGAPGGGGRGAIPGNTKSKDGQ
jgi:HlyD family secretion protein